MIMESNSILDEGESNAASNRKRIGTLKERSQHRMLKSYFEPDLSYHEIPVHTYIADICRDDLIYEIQTSGFGNLVSKLEVFLQDHEVRVIYPAAVTKKIVWSDPISGETFVGNCVTKRRVRYKLLSELLYIHRFISDDKFSIIVCETSVTDIRALDGRGKDRKIKATKLDRVLDGVVSQTIISSADDLRAFAELDLGAEYTSDDFAKRFGLKGRNLSAAVKSLILLGVIKQKRKEGRRIVYEVC